MTDQDMIINIATSLGKLGARLDQVEANIMAKVETEIRMVQSDFSHLEEKFNTEVRRGDDLFRQGIEKLENHETMETEKFQRHVATTEEQVERLYGKVHSMESRQDQLEQQIHALEIKPALDLYNNVKDRKNEGWKTGIGVAVTGAIFLIWELIKTMGGSKP
jgi:chromosome segregation ATPase